ncbi:protein FAM47E-like [Myotis lucifugus]|uniref:protein FAM47E-like n=1 Tax=Myotis lucifugus TaxID=59463 RepID=UPI0003C4772F|nr:protein FAM47E-like [Myotis lucifugus]
MAGQQWPLPEPHKGWLLKSDLRKKELIESGLIKPWQSGPKLYKKPELNKKWLLGPGPLEPLPLGMKCKPWFKDRDRLPSRYLSRQNNKLGKCPTSMDSRRIPRPPPKKIHRQPPKGADLCSKLSPAQRARKAFVENIEASLTKHPLANCPNLEAALPPDLMLKVLEVVDPDRELEDTWAYCSEPGASPGSEPRTSRGSPPRISLEAQPGTSPGRQPRISLEAQTGTSEEVNLEPENKAHLEMAKESLQSYLFSLFPEEETNAACTKDIPKVPGLQQSRRRVREFCRWIDDNFGDIGIDEEYILKKFEIDFEVPLTNNAVKIKKISQLPLNIRPCKQLDDIQQRKFSLQEGNWGRKLRKPEDPYKPKREKIRYGAWYLDPKCWKKLVNDQPLPDPKVVPDKEHWTYGRHLEPDIIDEPYGPIAFKDFIVSKGYKMPVVTEKMFLRKGWTYESVKTPIHRVILFKPKEEDSGNKED